MHWSQVDGHLKWPSIVPRRCEMGRRGNCYDNAAAARFFSNLKYEFVHRHTSQPLREVRADLCVSRESTISSDWIEVWRISTSWSSSDGAVALNPESIKLGLAQFAHFSIPSVQRIMHFHLISEDLHSDFVPVNRETTYANDNKPNLMTPLTNIAFLYTSA